jgi:hypothetical protein
VGLTDSCQKKKPGITGSVSASSAPTRLGKAVENVQLGEFYIGNLCSQDQQIRFGSGATVRENFRNLRYIFSLAWAKNPPSQGVSVRVRF